MKENIRKGATFTWKKNQKKQSSTAFRKCHVWDHSYSFCVRMIDDTSISSSSEIPLQLLEDLKRELERIMNWLRRNKQILNIASLSWSQHYKIGKGKLKGGLNSIVKLREILTQSQLFLVYQALILSHLRYGSLIWGQLSEMYLCALQKIQKRAFYLIESTPIKDRIPSTWINVEKVITYDQSILVYNILKEFCPENLKGKFMRRNKI